MNGCLYGRSRCRSRGKEWKCDGDNDILIIILNEPSNNCKINQSDIFEIALLEHILRPQGGEDDSKITACL